MNGYYGYFNKSETFAYDDSWATLISTDKDNNILEFSTIDFDGLIHMIKRILCFSSQYKCDIMFSFAKYDEPSTLFRSRTWVSSLLIACQIFNIKEEHYSDGNMDVTRPAILLVKCNDKIFKLIIHYGEYLLLKMTTDVCTNSDEETVELNYPFSKESINPNGSIKLHEDRVGSCDGFTVHLKKGDENQHHRPHVQCLMSGKKYNISIDDNVEYLGDGKVTSDIRFIERELKKNKQVLQDARVLWNTIPSNYKFEKNEKGELVPPKK